MAIEVQLFNGTILEFPDGTDPTVIDRVAKEQTLTLNPPEEPGLLDRMGAGLERLTTSYGTGISTLMGDKAAREAAEKGVREQERISRELGPVRGFGEVAEAYEKEGILAAGGEFASQVPGAIAEQVPNLAGFLGATALGGAAGSVIPGLGTAVGGVTGAILYLYPQFLGSNLEEQAAQDIEAGRAVDLEYGKAAAGAGVQAAFEAAGNIATLGMNTIRRVVGKEVSKAAAEKKLLDAAQRSLSGAVGRGALGGTTEIPVEIGQEIVNRWQSGQDLLSDEAIADYGMAAYGALQAGPAMGALAGPVDRASARKELARRGMTSTGEALPTEAVAPERQQQLAEEQQTADLMRQRDIEAFEARQRSLAKEQEPSGQFRLNLPKEKRVAPTTSVQGTPLAPQQKGFDPFGRPLTPEVEEQAPTPYTTEPTDISKALEGTFNIADLDREEAQLRQTLTGLDRTKANRPQAQAIRDRLTQIKDLKSQIDVLELTPPKPEKTKAAKPDTVLTTAELTATGLPPYAGYLKQLSGLDLAVQEDRTKAAEIIGRAVENNKVKPEAKDALKALYEQKVAEPVAQGQQAFDFTEPEVEAAPSTTISQDTLNELGVGRSAVLRRNNDLLGLDYTDPENAPFIRSALETYRDTRGRPEATVQKIDEFLATLPEAPAKGETDVSTESVTTEPTTERPAGEPSVGVVDVGDGAATTQEDTTGAVSEPEVGGLEAPVAGVTPDVERGEPVSGAVTEEAQIEARERQIKDLIDTFYAQNKKESNFGYDFNLPSGIYEGQIENKKRVGKGRMSYDNGVTYLGNFVDGEIKDPNGTLILRDRTIFTGDMDGINGVGELTLLDGTRVPARLEGGEVVFIDTKAPPKKKAPKKETKKAPTVEAPAETKPAPKPRAKKAPKSIKEVEPIAPTKETEVRVAADATFDDKLAEIQTIEEPSKKDIAGLTKQAFEEGRINAEDQRKVSKALAQDGTIEALDELVTVLNRAKNSVANAAQTLRVNGDAPGAVTPAFDNAVNKQDPKATLQAIRDDDTAAFNPSEQLVAKKILDMSGPLPTMRMVDSLGNDANGYPILGQYDSIADEIRLVRGAADSHTFLHEMIHAFVHRTIIDQEATGARKPAFKQLQDVYNYVKEKRPDLADTYGMTNLTEFAAEAMSNREFQMQLMGIEYKKDSVFGWFAKQLRTLLGLDDTGAVGNTLFTAMVAVDGLLRTGRDLQLATKGKEFVGSDVVNATTQAKQNVDTPLGKPLPSTLAEVNKAPDQVLNTELNKFAHMYAQKEVAVSDIIRQKAVDVLAPVAKKLNNAFNEGVKKQFGDVNPLVWMRQAFDHQRIALQVFRAGGLRMKKDGTWEAFELKNSKGDSVSAQKMIELIRDFAKKEGTAYATMKGRVSTVLEGMRLKDLREHNAKLEALAVEQSRGGDIDAAYETRKNKFALHMTNEEIDALVAIYEKTPEIKEIQNVMNAVRENLVDAMVAAGRLTDKQADAWKAAVNYVPFERLKKITDDTNITFGIGRKGLAALSQLPELRGSFDRPVVNTIDSFMNKMAWMTEQSMRNSAVVRTLNVMAEMGMARKLVNKKQAQDSALVLDKVYENGKPVLFEVQNEYDLAAFLQAPEKEQGTLMKLFSGASRTLRTTVTATPMFAVKQVFDDAQRVMFYSGVKNPYAAAGRTLINLPRILVSKALGKESKTIKELERLGIVGDYDFNIIKPAETIEMDAKAVKRSPVGALLHAMEQVTKASDMAARLAVYEQTMKESNDSTLAHNRARELINFNRRGTSTTMQALTHVVPFFNSWAQGMDLLYRGFTGVDASSVLSKKAAMWMFIRRIGMMMAFSTAYALLMGEDEGYEDASDEVRDRAWILPKFLSDAFGMDQPFRIPVPIELGFIFKSIPERALQYYRDSTKKENKPAVDAVLDFMHDAAGVYGMAPVPAAIKPGLENLFNFSTFNKRELVSPMMANRPNALQYTSSTSEFGKWLGEKTDTSPILIDNFMRGYFGLMWSSASMMLDGMMNPARPARNLNQLPFLSIGLMAPVGTRTKDDFYEFREKVAEAVAGKNMLVKEAPDKLGKFLDKNQYLLAAAPFVNEKARALRYVRDMKKVVNASSMSSDEKRAELTRFEKLEVDILADMRKLRADFEKLK